MSQEILGNVTGLASLEKKKLQRLFSRRVDKADIVSLDLARELYSITNELRRKVGLIVGRDGNIYEVVVGSKELLYIPDLGRYRLGKGRLRRLRLIFPDLTENNDPPLIPLDIYTDLEKLRLDMVVAVKVRGNRTMITYAHMLPSSQSKSSVRTETVKELSSFSFNFDELMDELEGELSSEFERTHDTTKTSAILVGVYESSLRVAERSMLELEELAKTADVQVLDRIIQRRPPDPKTLVGKGKLEAIVLNCLRLGAEMIIFDGELKAGQWRAITNATELKIIDRSMLILDIFAQRAKSSEGRLQVELAQLKYNLPRLVEKDAGLSRLTGGIGGRGPGETKLEIGRRRIRERIGDLEKKIEKIASQRQLRRRKRKEEGIPLVSILGYTNAGKSTLFNALTNSDVLAENRLFATLDPAQRRLRFPRDDSRRSVVLSDTVGFIRNLPSELRNAFRATLEELYEASLLLHVLDVSDSEYLDHKSSVDLILGEMGLSGMPLLLVLNKIDKLPSGEAELITNELGGIPISASTGTGLDSLLDVIKARIFKDNDLVNTESLTYEG